MFSTHRPLPLTSCRLNPNLRTKITRTGNPRLSIISVLDQQLDERKKIKQIEFEQNPPKISLLCHVLQTVAAMAVPSKCFACNVNREQLCFQLNQLYGEADNTRLKAKNARQRLMRLSDAAEKLRRQAAIELQKGKEEDARDLLFQKKKIMQVMDKSKNRIQLLDELCAKLNEAISLKENQLVCNVGLDVELDKESSQIPIRIVSPSQEASENINVDKDLICNDENLVDNQKITLSADNLPNVADNQGSPLSLGSENEDNLISSLQKISSYEDFLEHLDIQFHKIEAELVSILCASNIILGNEEIKRNLKVDKTKELLDSVREIRQRIVNIQHAEDT